METMEERAIDQFGAEPQPEPPSAPVPVVDDPGDVGRIPAAVYLVSKDSSVGRRGLQRSLDRAAEILTDGGTRSAFAVDWSAVRYQHVAALRAVLREQNAKPATINHVLSAVRGTIKEAWRLGLIDSETYTRAIDVRNVSRSQLPAGRHVDAGEVAALFRACGDSLVGARDAALLGILAGAGLRRAEAVALQLEDYGDGTLKVLNGKGAKDRVVFLPAGARRAVENWIARRGAWPGALLCPIRRGGALEQRTMTAQAILLRVRHLSKRAGIAQISPHDLRRTFVGELLEAGADVSSVAKLAGHANPTTTARYDRRPDEAKRRAAELLHIPYDGPTRALHDPQGTDSQDDEDQIPSQQESC